MKTSSISKSLARVKSSGRHQVVTLLLGFATLAIASSAVAQHTFTSIDYPGGVATTLRGINNQGDMVGGYSVPGQPRHALLIKRGKFIPLGAGTVLATNYSEAFKINDRGDSVGRYISDDAVVHGFLLSKKGILTTLDFPTASETLANGIDESGTVVGWWDILDADGNLLAQQGFTWEKGTFSEVNFPGSAKTAVWANNTPGNLVGSWGTELSLPDHGPEVALPWQAVSMARPKSLGSTTMLTGSRTDF
jgi:uncharacterized membrane protein